MKPQAVQHPAQTVVSKMKEIRAEKRTTGTQVTGIGRISFIFVGPGEGLGHGGAGYRRPAAFSAI